VVPYSSTDANVIQTFGKNVANIGSAAYNWVGEKATNLF